MADKVFEDGYRVITFKYGNNIATIYVDKTLKLPNFKIEILEKLFKRTIFNCGNDNTIDIIVNKLRGGFVSVVGYLYNNFQNYDFCEITEDAYFAIHITLSILFNLSMNSEDSYCSIQGISRDMRDDQEDEEDDDYDYDDDYNDNPPITRGEKRKMDKLGRIIDKILKNKEKDW